MLLRGTISIISWHNAAEAFLNRDDVRQAASLDDAVDVGEEVMQLDLLDGQKSSTRVGRGMTISSPDIHAFLQPARQPRVVLANLGAWGQEAEVGESQGDGSRKDLRGSLPPTQKGEEGGVGREGESQGRMEGRARRQVSDSEAESEDSNKEVEYFVPPGSPESAVGTLAS